MLYIHAMLCFKCLTVINITVNLEIFISVQFQVMSKKKTVRHNLPIQIGFFVYSYAKLRMLSFYFDVLIRYIPRSLFSLCEMDTG